MLFLEEQRTGDRENEPPAVGDPGGPAMEGKGSGRFGPVTKQGAAGIEKLRSGKIAYCTQWNEGIACTRGVLKGKHKGLCAYTHKCLKSVSDHTKTGFNSAVDLRASPVSDIRNRAGIVIGKVMIDDSPYVATDCGVHKP